MKATVMIRNPHYEEEWEAWLNGYRREVAEWKREVGWDDCPNKGEVPMTELVEPEWAAVQKFQGGN